MVRLHTCTLAGSNFGAKHASLQGKNNSHAFEEKQNRDTEMELRSVKTLSNCEDEVADDMVSVVIVSSISVVVPIGFVDIEGSGVEVGSGTSPMRIFHPRN